MENQCNKNQYFLNGEVYFCSLELAVNVIGGKWKSLLLYHLQCKPRRSSELQQLIHGISNKMFTQAVRDLERDGLIKRTVFPVVPPKVEYELTELGRSVIPVINQLAVWGRSIGELYRKEE